MPEISRQSVDQLERLVVLLTRVVDDLKKDVFVPSEELLAHYEANRIANTCLFCGKELAGEVKRGVHPVCYNTAMHNVKTGEWSERDLLESGRIGIGKKPGRKSSKELPPIANAFNKTRRTSPSSSETASVRSAAKQDAAALARIEKDRAKTKEHKEK